MIASPGIYLVALGVLQRAACRSAMSAACPLTGAGGDVEAPHARCHGGGARLRAGRACISLLGVQHPREVADWFLWCVLAAAVVGMVALAVVAVLSLS
jgi:hypothetical protein